MITNLLSFSNKILTVGGNALSISSVDPYNPLGLPPYTIRLKFNDGVTPSFYEGTAVQVSSSPNVWDLTYQNTDWDYLVQNQYSLIEVLGANSTGVTSMFQMFSGCESMTTVSLFDTRSVTDMTYMFAQCIGLEEIPLFDTSSVTNMLGMFSNCSGLTAVPLLDTSYAISVDGMFEFCTNVESGALDMYQQMSSQTTPPSSHDDTFYECGVNTSSGYAELAQIPSSWGGTGS